MELPEEEAKDYAVWLQQAIKNAWLQAALHMLGLGVVCGTAVLSFMLLQKGPDWLSLAYLVFSVIVVASLGSYLMKRPLTYWATRKGEPVKDVSMSQTVAGYTVDAIAFGGMIGSGLALAPMLVNATMVWACVFGSILAYAFCSPFFGKLRSLGVYFFFAGALAFVLSSPSWSFSGIATFIAAIVPCWVMARHIAGKIGESKSSIQTVWLANGALADLIFTYYICAILLSFVS